MSQISVEEAVHLIRNNDIVAIPTETVYGLAGRIDSPEAIEKIFTTKKRPSFDPLIVHVRDQKQAQECCSEWNEALDLLTKKFWPGSLTVVVPKNKKISHTITAGLETVAIRCPNHPIALELLTKLSVPVAAPSANMFSKTSPTDAHHVEEEFGKKFPIVNGGPCQVGLESTICQVTELDLSKRSCQLSILRRGAVLAEHLKAELEKHGWTVLINIPKGDIVAPGQLKIHYRPVIPLVLINADFTTESEVLNSLTSDFDTSHPQWLNLVPQPEIAARTLYADLRHLGKPPSTVLICRWSKDWTGEFWQTIYDRLSRAATKVI